MPQEERWIFEQYEPADTIYQLSIDGDSAACTVVSAREGERTGSGHNTLMEDDVLIGRDGCVYGAVAKSKAGRPAGAQGPKFLNASWYLTSPE